MLECVSVRPSTPNTNASIPTPSNSNSNSQGNSTDVEESEEGEEEDEDASTASLNVSTEFLRAVQAPSYNEIRSIIQAPPPVHHPHDEDSHHRYLLSQLLQPDSNSVREALAKSTSKLTCLVSTYFDHSETTSDFCLRLLLTILRARDLYAPLSRLLSVLPADGPPLSQAQCDRAYDLFLQFDSQENPFVLSHLHQLRDSFSHLKGDIQRDLRRCHSRIRMFRHATAGCAVISVAVIAAVAVVAVHAAIGFTAVAATPFCVPRQKRRELARLKQLEAAENGTLVVNDINTIDSLVDRLQTAVEADKAFVRIALERGRERHPIQQVLKELTKNQPVLEHLLGDLEQHIYFCFYSVNKARYALLKEICNHQNLYC
ncbi:UPF0496 protein At3g19330-like [Vigna umbellata]|uniref:UPF0496 protein At3g19330-like n=1 Tax=Vigna umbellata TaxID=87088 RepID=UPI001F5F4BED|nr:UPF0496 protein At3g19330-like [Vigna umbellata]